MLKWTTKWDKDKEGWISHSDRLSKFFSGGISTITQLVFWSSAKRDSTLSFSIPSTRYTLSRVEHVTHVSRVTVVGGSTLLPHIPRPRIERYQFSVSRSVPCVSSMLAHHGHWEWCSNKLKSIIINYSVRVMTVEGFSLSHSPDKKEKGGN